MERWFAYLSLMLLGVSLCAGLGALREWEQGQDLWGLYLACLSLTSGMCASRIFGPATEDW